MRRQRNLSLSIWGQHLRWSRVLSVDSVMMSDSNRRYSVEISERSECMTRTVIDKSCGRIVHGGKGSTTMWGYDDEAQIGDLEMISCERLFVIEVGCVLGQRVLPGMCSRICMRRGSVFDRLLRLFRCVDDVVGRDSVVLLFVRLVGTVSETRVGVVGFTSDGELLSLVCLVEVVERDVGGGDGWVRWFKESEGTLVFILGGDDIDCGGCGRFESGQFNGGRLC
ncbi:hypothetical protein Tco_1321026 [Tanacetum coccineum]